MTISTTVEPSTDRARLRIPDGGKGGLTAPEYVAYVESEGLRFARVAEEGGLDVPISACPDWDMRDLVRHLGEIHLWAATNVAFPKPTWLNVPDLTELEPYWPDLAAAWPSDDDLVAWYRATHENLLHVLRSAPRDVQAFTFLPAATPVTMWARRQASEIAIHRFDAESARGVRSVFDPDFSADMLDELLSGFTRYFRRVVAGDDRVLHVRADDVDEQWWVTIGSQGVRSSREGGEADLVVSGPAAELYLSLWNRTADSHVAMSGDPSIMERWRASCRVEWAR